jgi:hypothetical protein
MSWVTPILSLILTFEGGHLCGAENNYPSFITKRSLLMQKLTQISQHLFALNESKFKANNVNYYYLTLRFYTLGARITVAFFQVLRLKSSPVVLLFLAYISR